MTISKTDRKLIDNLAGQISSVVSEVSDLLSKYQERYDGLSDKAKENERGENLHTLVEQLENASSNLEDAQAALDSLT